jgi:hypothetical protein
MLLYILMKKFSYAGVVMLVPLIQFSSTFVKTSKIAELYASQAAHQELIRFVQLEKGLRFLEFD